MTLHVDDLPYLRAVQAFARSIGRSRELAEQLRFLARLLDSGRSGRTRTRLWADCAPRSFRFVVERTLPNGMVHTFLDGALVYHGRHDGYGSGAWPTFAVTLTPTDGWSIHT